MSVLDFLLDLFGSEEQQAALADDPTAFLAEHGPEGLTAADILEAMPGVCAALPPEQAEALRATFGLQADGPGGSGGSSVDIDPSGGPALPPPPPPTGDPVQDVIQSINHYTNVVNLNQQYFEDNDITTIDDRDTTVDQSVNQNINAYGDVNQTFDNDVVSGDGAVAAGDDAQVNTGDGAVQAGDDISDSTIATGDVEGSVFGDVSDSVVGDGNQVIDDSTVGAAAFGEGDATNVVADNAVLGGGTLVDAGGDVALNQGSGDLTQIEDSTLTESVVGDGSVESNDIDADIDGDGNAIAFGDGDATADTQTTEIHDNFGNVQVAGDESTQTMETDNSINDSGNVTDSGNLDVDTTVDIDASQSYDYESTITDSGNTTTEVDDHSIDTTVDASDDDGIDADLALG